MRLLTSSYQLRRLARGVLMGIAIALCGAALALTPLGTSFERTFGLDWLFNMRGAVTAPPEAIVVAIDSTTGDKLGLPKLPRDWPRTTHAELVKRLVDRNVGVIVFDMDFSRAKSAYEDLTFANAIAEANRVVLFEWLDGRKERIFDTSGAEGGWTWIEEKQSPTPPLALAAKALGPFPLPKTDQAVFEFWTFKPSLGDAATTAAIAVQLNGLAAHDRWLEVLAEAKAPHVDDLPLRAADLKGPEQLHRMMQLLRSMFIDDPELADRIKWTLDQQSDVPSDVRERRLISALATLYGGPDNQYLNFYGPPGTIRTIPYHALFASQEGSSTDGIGNLAGKVVFVGYSDLYSPDQPDRFFTVFTGEDGIDLSGVEIMATAFANLIEGRTIRPSSAVVTALCVLLFGLAVGTGAYLLPAMWALPTAFILAGAYAVGAQWQFNAADLWLPVAIPALVQLPMALLIGLMGQYLLERRKERQMARAISYYLPENIVRDLTEREISPDAVNKVVYGTCLATDMSGFTTLSESKSPKELAAFMNEYFDTLAQALKRHAVDVTEFHADTIMCAWTAPEKTSAVCRKAALAAVDVNEAIERFAHEHGAMRLNPRIGLQDGNFYLGHTGGGGRLAYSILGDPANTAARLESLNRHLGTRVLAAESVVADADGILVRPLGVFRLMGKADPSHVVEILGKRSAADDDKVDLCTRFAEALAAFQSQEWQTAAQLFESNLARHAEDGPSRFYLARCQYYLREGVPPDEPTVIHMEAK